MPENNADINRGIFCLITIGLIGYYANKVGLMELEPWAGAAMTIIVIVVYFVFSFLGREE